MQDLALYLHWPYCARICPYCDFNVVRARGRTDEETALVEAMAADIAEQARRIGRRRLVSIFFGGGTPSLLAPAAVERLIRAATDAFAPAGDLEITLEANPTDAEAGRFADLASAGVQRLSLGVQALDDDALAFLGRNHDAAEARRAAGTAARAFPRLSIDLIYARPGQTPDAWARELQDALAWGPEHVSPYQLTIEQETAFGRAARRGSLVPPDPELAADLFDVTQTVLEGAGFHAYEVSNHARGEAARSRHNLAIWKGAEYLGAGPGAHGRIQLDGARTATRAEPKIAGYIARVGESGVGFATVEPLSDREADEERVMLGLRIDEGVEIGLVDPDRAATLIDAGLLTRKADRIAATPAGRLVLDRVISELLT